MTNSYGPDYSSTPGEQGMMEGKLAEQTGFEEYTEEMAAEDAELMAEQLNQEEQD